MLSYRDTDCPACGGRIHRGEPIKRYVRRVGGWGKDGHWEDTGKYRHVTCPKVRVASDRAARVSRAQVLDYDGL